MDYNRYKLIKARLSEGLEVPYAEWLVYKDYEKKYKAEISVSATAIPASTFNRSSRSHATGREFDIDYLIENAIENYDNFSISMEI